MATVGAISYSANTELHKSLKIWREAVKYVPRIDRARILRRMRSVLTLDKVALRRAMEREYAGQRQQKDAQCYRVQQRVGLLTPPIPVASGNRLERREKERSKRESLRDQGTIFAGIGKIAESNCGW